MSVLRTGFCAVEKQCAATPLGATRAHAMLDTQGMGPRAEVRNVSVPSSKPKLGSLLALSKGAACFIPLQIRF